MTKRAPDQSPVTGGSPDARRDTPRATPAQRSQPGKPSGHSLGNPRPRQEGFPSRGDAASQLDVHAVGVTFAGQQFLVGSGVRVGVALVVFLRVEDADRRGQALFEQIELAEELGKLIFEIKVLNVNVVYFREMAEKLVKSECSGPH